MGFVPVGQKSSCLPHSRHDILPFASLEVSGLGTLCVLSGWSVLTDKALHSMTALTVMHVTSAISAQGCIYASGTCISHTSLQTVKATAGDRQPSCIAQVHGLAHWEGLRAILMYRLAWGWLYRA